MDVIISNGLFIIKIRVFCGQRISGVPLKDSARLPTLFGLSPLDVFEPVRVFHPRENLALLEITHHMFFSMLCNRQLCWTSSNSTEPTHQSPSMMIDHNHVLTPIPCDVPVHMQYNMSLHFISCHMHNECYMDNAKTIHFTVYHRQLYLMHTISIQSHIPCQYIYTQIYQHLITQLPPSMLCKTKQQHP